MLHVESISQPGGSGMGQSGSRANSIDTAASGERMEPNGTANGVVHKHYSPTRNSRFDSSTQSRDGRGRNPLNRARHEWEDDRYEPNGSHGEVFAHKGSRELMHHSSPRDRQSLSPSSMRHSFIPERNDDQWKHSTSHQHQRINSGGSNPAHRRGRADQWIPSRTFSSPPPRSPISPPMRPVLASRANSASESSTLQHSFPADDRRGSESMDRPRYTNLKWTNPDLQPTRTSTASASKVFVPGGVIESPLSPVEDKWNGSIQKRASIQDGLSAFKSAPTGPKLERNLLAANNAANRRPFIFIPGESLPPSPSTLDHLFKFLAKWVKRRADINFDGKGWYLYFDNTESGLHRLDECYWAKTRQKLFSQYVLEMVRHPDGLKDADLNRRGNDGDHSIPSVVAHVGRATDSIKCASTVLSDMSTFGPALSRQAPAATSDPRLALRVPGIAPTFSIETHANGYISPLRHSSPLRVPSAFDREETSSSVSGVTGSDLSVSKLSKCHVCKKVSDHDVLVLCSTCPRRWHHRCHLNPAISSALEPDHSWQCKRCVKKNVQPKSRLSHASFTDVVSPVPSVGQSDEPPMKKRRLALSESRESSLNLLNDNPSEPLKGFHSSTIGSLDQGTIQSPTYNPDQGEIDDIDLGVTTPANRDVLDDLVEQSFSTSNVVAQPQQRSKKSGSLNLTRKKVTRPAVETVTDRGDVEHLETLPDEVASDAIAPKAGFSYELLEETLLKRKPHKWSGGGADRSIIAAGLKTSFLDPNARRTREEAVDVASRVEVVKTVAQTPHLEIPESPEESRTPNKSTDKRTEHTTAASAVESQPSPKVKLKLNNTKSTERHETEGSTSKIQMVPPQRMKATGSSAGGRCKQCNKQIAFNPAGKKLCVGCKKSVAIEAPTPPMGQQLKDDGAVVDDLQPTTPTAAEQINLGILDLLKYTPSAQEEGSENGKERGSASSPLRPDAACETCRARHKRCTHRSAPATSGQENQNNDDTTAEDDLNFWDVQHDRGIHRGTTSGDGEQNGAQSDGDRIVPKDDGDQSSSLSDAPEDSHSQATKAKKRMSHTRPATSEFDIGDSWSRPVLSYTKLICMALLAAPNQCLSAKEIENWIDENIPSYNSKEGNWVSGISPTLSMGMEKDGKAGLWMKVGGEGPKKNAKCWYQLLPGNEHKMLHWDPVLKEPCWPLKHGSEDKRPKGKTGQTESPGHSHSGSKQQGGEALKVPTQARTPKKRVKNNLFRTPKRPTKHAPKIVHDDESLPLQKRKGAAIEDMDIDELQLSDVKSSDEEPLVTSRRTHSVSAEARRDVEAATHKVNNVSGVQTLAVIDSHTMAPKAPAKLPRRPQPAAVDWKLVAQLIKEDSEKVDYSAKSLYEEWPEWDPKNRFEPDAKTAEIQSRPTKKQRIQRFGTKSKDPWARWKPDVSQREENSINSPSKSSRAIRSFEEPVFEWQKNEDVKYYNSFEEMFGVPELPIPFIQDDKIAYRDGTWNDYEGSLRRAKKIYPTGYAKS